MDPVGIRDFARGRKGQTSHASGVNKQEKNDGFLPTARHSGKDVGRGEKRVLA